MADSTEQLNVNHIVFTNPGKPVLISREENMQREATIDLYRDEINSAHNNAGK